MKIDELRAKRDDTEREMRQIIEHDGEINSEMAGRYEELETASATISNELKSEEIRERHAARQAQPVRVAAAPGQKIETTQGGDEWGGYLRWWRSCGKENRALNTSDDSGVVPTVLASEMLRLFGAVQGVRQAVQVTSAEGDTKVPTVTTRVALTDVTAEGAAADEVEPAFGQADFTTDKNIFATTELTVQVMQDSNQGLVEEVQTQHAEEIGRLWSSYYCNGLTVDSSLQTDGIFATAPSGINTKTFASATTITAAELIDIRYGQLPAQYWSGMGDLNWIMGQDTFAHVMALVDGNDRPIFQPNASSTMAAGLQGTLLGLPVYIDAAAPAFGTGNAVLALMARNAYRIVDRMPGMVTNINPWAQQNKGLVEINTYQRSVGRWMRPQAAVVATMG